MTKRQIRKAKKLYYKITNDYNMTIAQYKGLKMLQQIFKGSQLYIGGTRI